jgi:hypothetical protein
MKRQGADRLQAKLAEMTEEQRQEFWVRRYEEMLAKQIRLRDRDA